MTPGCTRGYSWGCIKTNFQPPRHDPTIMTPLLKKEGKLMIFSTLTFSSWKRRSTPTISRGEVVDFWDSLVLNEIKYVLISSLRSVPKNHPSSGRYRFPRYQRYCRSPWNLHIHHSGLLKTRNRHFRWSCQRNLANLAKSRTVTTDTRIIFLTKTSISLPISKSSAIYNFSPDRKTGRHQE